MKLAYLMLAHKNSRQLDMLISNLEDEYTDLFIHVDKKNDDLYNHLVIKYNDKNNIFIIKNRVSVNWSGFSQVQATLNLIRNLIDSGRNYEYVSLISGQCFPLKSNKYIRNFLVENKGSEFIEYMDITNDQRYLYRLKTYNFFREYKNIRKFHMRVLDNIVRRLQKPFVKRKNFMNLRLYRGSQWFTITFECLKYLLTYIEENPSILNDFRYTMVPDEHFFQVIIMNSPYSSKVINNNLRYIDWENCKNSPKVFDSSDFDKLKYSSNLIARKFDLDKDSKVLDQLTMLVKK